MTRWLDDPEMAAWRGLIEVGGDVQADLDADLRAAHGLHLGDYAVLVHLSEAEEHRLRMCDLADLLHLSPSGLTRRLDGMVRQGLVAREQSADDRRVILAVLTDAGERRLAEAAPTHVEGVRRALLDHLSARQVAQLAEIFTALRVGRAVRSVGAPSAETDEGSSGAEPVRSHPQAG